MPSIKATAFLILAASGALAQQYSQLYARGYEQDLYARDLNDLYGRAALENDLYARDLDRLYTRHLEQDFYARGLQARALPRPARNGPLAKRTGGGGTEGQGTSQGGRQDNINELTGERERHRLKAYNKLVANQGGQVLYNSAANQKPLKSMFEERSSSSSERLALR